ncbi:DUF1214 domain-containing protein [Pseudomonas sp. MDT1-17]
MGDWPDRSRVETIERLDSGHSCQPYLGPRSADGSVTICIGPKSPGGLESNWIPTAGKRPLPAMRFYGGTEALNNKSFKLPDFELIE